jgi:hypothetical protein
MTVELSDLLLSRAAEWGRLRMTEAKLQGRTDSRGLVADDEHGVKLHQANIAAVMATYLGLLRAGFRVEFDMKDLINTYRRVPAIRPNWDVCCRSNPNYDLLISQKSAVYTDRNIVLAVIETERKFHLIGYINIGQAVKHKEWLQTYGGRPPAWFVPQSALTPITERN